MENLNKYHINNNGEIGRCYAKHKCRFSSNESHFFNKQQAERFNDYINENHIDFTIFTKEEKEQEVAEFKEKEFANFLKKNEDIRNTIEDIFNVDISTGCNDYQNHFITYNIVDVLAKNTYHEDVKKFLEYENNRDKLINDVRTQSFDNICLLTTGLDDLGELTKKDFAFTLGYKDFNEIPDKAIFENERYKLEINKKDNESLKLTEKTKNGEIEHIYIRNFIE